MVPVTIQVQPVPVKWPDKCTWADEVEKGLSMRNCHFSVGLGHVCLGEVFWFGVGSWLHMGLTMSVLYTSRKKWLVCACLRLRW